MQMYLHCYPVIVVSLTMYVCSSVFFFFNKDAVFYSSKSLLLITIFKVNMMFIQMQLCPWSADKSLLKNIFPNRERV